MARTLAALFATEEALRDCLDGLRHAGAFDVRTFTPKPLENGPAHSPLPAWVLLAGVGGALAGFLMQAYATGRAYPVDIGGRPTFSWPAYVPISFEIGVLCAVLTGVFGYFAINRMPRLYDPVDELPLMQEAMRDGWIVIVTTEDVRAPTVRELLRCHAPRQLTEYIA